MTSVNPHEITEEAIVCSAGLPVQEVFYLIDQGFKSEIGRYPRSGWKEPKQTQEDIMDKYTRYRNMVGTEEFARLEIMICLLRLVHRVCSQCGNNQKQLKRCGKCRMTFYCSKECQSLHWTQFHKFWCRQRFTGSRDTGPAGMVLLEKKKRNIQQHKTKK